MLLSFRFCKSPIMLKVRVFSKKLDRTITTLFAFLRDRFNPVKQNNLKTNHINQISLKNKRVEMKKKN